MIDFNKGSYIKRCVKGNPQIEGNIITVNSRGTIQDETTHQNIVEGKDIDSVITVEEYKYLEEKTNSSRILPIIAGVVAAVVAVWIFYIKIQIMSWVLIYAMFFLFLPTVGLLVYYIFRNVLSPARKTKLCYEVNVVWHDNEYIMILEEKDYIRLKSR